MTTSWINTLAVLVVGCSASASGDSATKPGAASGPVPPESALGPDASASDDAGVSTPAGLDPCGGGHAFCSAYNVRSRCVAKSGTRTYVDEPCPVGCSSGVCVADACSDECALGETRGGLTCRLFDVRANREVPREDASSTRDRARGYEARLRKFHLPSGGVLSANFTDPSLTTIHDHDSIVDSALWTGTGLAAESLRFLATGEADAARRVDAMSATLHDWFAVTATPGYVARYATPISAPLPGYTWGCGNQGTHCAVPYRGEPWNWRGDTSRDQYSGVMLGLWLAWEATPDDAVRARIAGDVLTVVEELMKKRTKVPTHATINGAKFDLALDIENAIMAPASELRDGKVTVEIDTSDLNGGELDGVREFVPDLQPLLQQLPLIGAVAPSVPRPGSAAMLGAFFRMALEMSASDPTLATRRAAIQSYYDAHVDHWIEVAKGYKSLQKCGAKYYAIHIAFIASYAWASLETDPVRGALVRDEVLGRSMWTDLVAGHKNPYFAFMWAGTRTTKPDVSAFAAQLAQFPPAPRLFRGVDVVAKYPHDEACSSGGKPQAAKSTAVDVGDRVVSDFQWQRHPWNLFAVPAPTMTAPGVDYLVAYWAARRHELMADDRAGTCARFMP